MKWFFDFISNNAIVSTIVAAAIIGVVTWLFKYFCDWRDSKLIYNFLVSSRSSSSYGFRSTTAIASNTRLPESRVSKLCASHSKIRRNEKQLESWALVD